jgi:N-acetylmuramoyl-L-alanine amidase
VTLGALLFLGLIAVSLGAGGMLGSNEDAPTPTATLAPTVLPPLGLPTEIPSPTPTMPREGRWPGEGDGRAVVCLDPGHGGWDPGYTRVAYAGLPAMAEADFTLAQAYDLKARLEERGFVVVMTRRTPNAVNAEGLDVNGDGATIADSVRAGELDEMQARINVCNEARADLLVSMHVNGFDRPSPTAIGYETWYTGSRPFGEQSERFATLAFRALGDEMTTAGYAAVAREINNDDEISVDASDPALADHMIMTGPDVRGAIEASQMPGAIIESLFISNDADAYFLASNSGHDAIVTAYEAAIVQYFNEFPG